MQLATLLSWTLMHGLHDGGRYSARARKPSGPYITGVSGPNSPSVGAPIVAATCIGPESLVTTTLARESTYTSEETSSSPARLTQRGLPTRWAMPSVYSRSAFEPISTTDQPSDVISRCASSMKRGAGQRRSSDSSPALGLSTA